MNEAEKWLAESSLGDTWGGIAVLFLLFLFFFGGSLGYGSLLGRRLFPNAGRLDAISSSFLFATLFLGGSAFFLAAVHGLARVSCFAAWGIFSFGLLLEFKELPRFKLSIKRWPFYFVLALFVFFLRALSAAQPAQHGDPLLYHLLGPRLWMEGGGFLMHPNLPNALLASSWECLYLWPQLLWFSSKPLFGLVEAQLFSQWLHLFLGWGGCALLVMRLFRRSVFGRWLPLLGFGALFVAGLQWTAPLAKNDLGIALWCLGAVVFFLEGLDENSKVKFLLSGLFAGLALTGKITALLSLAPLLGISLLLAAPWRQPMFFATRGAIWLGGLLAGALPIYVRNFLLSGNPFFPLFPHLFPSPWLSLTWQAHFAQVHPSSPLHSFPRLWQRAPELIHESPFCVAGLLFLLFAWWAKRSGNPRTLGLLVGALASFIIFVLTQGPEIELRYLGASLLVLSAGGLCFLLEIGDRLPEARMQLAFGVAITIALMAGSRLPLHILRKIWSGPLGVEFVKTHTAGEAKAWLRAHARGPLTIVAGDNETYYLTPLQIAVLTERPDLDAATHEEKDLSRFVALLCEKSRAHFLLDARPGIGLGGRFGAEALQPNLVFTAQGANVYDLQAIEARLLPASQPHHCL